MGASYVRRRFAYVVHLRTFMTLWLGALPFALLGSCGWLTIPTVGVVAYALLGIESIGVEIENPCAPAIFHRIFARVRGGGGGGQFPPNGYFFNHHRRPS